MHLWAGIMARIPAGRRDAAHADLRAGGCGDEHRARAVRAVHGHRRAGPPGLRGRGSAEVEVCEEE